jgi:3-oxoacyl-[acyl-carrier-protein] synthase II
VAPDEGSVTRCIQAALRDAGVRPQDVDYISAHGTGTPMNDAVESRAIRAVFGDTPPPASSVKSMIGHTMGAASGFGAIASVLALLHQRLPPTINHRTIDPAFPWIDPIPGRSRPARVRLVQNHGFAFGGNNAVVVLGAA